MESFKISRESCIYTSCYCEENIWKLCEKINEICLQSLDNCYVVFVSNDQKQVPIWFQRSGKESRDYLCIWDYHVFLVQKGAKDALVYDFDSLLDFPTPFNIYIKQALRPDFNFCERMFRVILSKTYLSSFASDRSHMKKPDGCFISDPPVYEEIRTKDCTNNIHDFISMEKGRGYGEIMSFDNFCKYFSINH